MKGLVADVSEVRRSIALFLEPGSVIELRAPKTEREGVISGYFSDPEKLTRAVVAIDSRAPGVYVTLNPVNPDLLARADNRIKSRARELTVDREIVRRRWLLLDFDPVRPAGISSTAAEHDAALEKARNASAALSSEGWPGPVRGDSGNGGHLLYRIDLPNDSESAALIKAALKACAQRWSVEKSVDVDVTVFNASRISKIYGSVARKGDSTIDRPHRISRILSLPADLAPVSLEQLRSLASEAKPDQPKRSSAPVASPSRNFSRSTFDVEQFIVGHGIAIARGPDVHDGSRRWVLEHCPFDPNHRAPDAAIFQNISTGVPGFKCLHQSCVDKHWAQFREIYDPIANRPRRRSPEPPSREGEKSAADSDGDSRDEIPIGAADVEAAVDAAIAKDDLIDAVRLAAEVGTLRPIVRAVVIAKLREKFGRRFPAREFEKAMKEAAAAADGSPPPADGDDEIDPADEGPDLRYFPLTDAGNGERVVALFGREIRYCVETKRWLIWDGRRWAVDEFNIMRRRAKSMARRLHAQSRGDSTLAAWARASESYAAITNALGSAMTEKEIPVSVSQLDQHPYLLNCMNGVIDLRTGQLLKHSRDFLMTKLCPVPYKADAKCARFIEFVEWAMGANPDAEISSRTARLVGFLQKAFGYALTGDVSEKVMFIFYGEGGNNGKTTLLSVFRELLGRDYSGQLVIDTVMAMRNPDSASRADLADLRGVRLAVTSEVERDHRLNEGKIKYIVSGTDAPIKARRLYENPFEFLPTHKLFMDANYRPTVRGADDAIWRRLRLVPFEVTVSEDRMDKQLKQKLLEEQPGILAWAVRGCVEWLAHGFGDLPDLRRAEQEWREHDDPLKEFFDDCCEIDGTLWVSVRNLNEVYERWAKEARERFPLGREAFAERLHFKGLYQSRGRRDSAGKQFRAWEGIGLKADVVAPKAVWQPQDE